MGALLIEQDEKWATGRKYFEMDVYYDSVAPLQEPEQHVA